MIVQLPHLKCRASSKCHDYIKNCAYHIKLYLTKKENKFHSVYNSMQPHSCILSPGIAIHNKTGYGVVLEFC